VVAPDEPLRLTCDPTRLEQVLNNLVSNAIKYSPRGGAVWISISLLGASVHLSVADEGMGIMPEDVDHVFDPFRRTGASKEAIAGVGLGLFVARRIVEAHGGQLSVVSTPGHGSTFTVDIPVDAYLQVVAPSPMDGPSPLLG
jgi:signal transduction histidine kinase